MQSGDDASLVHKARFASLNIWIVDAQALKRGDFWRHYLALSSC